MSCKSIAFFGSSLVSAYWNGAATYYRGILKALAELDYAITFYEPDAFGRQQNRDLADPSYAVSVVYPATLDALDEQLADAASADIIVKASGVGVFDAYLESRVLELKTMRNLVIFWDVDAPATLDRVIGDAADYFALLIPQYDFVLTYGGGRPVVQAYTTLGAKKCVPVYNALDPETHYPAEPDARFEADLGFLGNRMPDREARVEEFFFKPARMLPTKRFLLGGNGWESNAPRLENVRTLGHIYTADHNAFNATPTAVLNISRESMARYGFSPATRLFEAAGAAACVVTDQWAGIETFLTPGEECLVAANGSEVAQIVSGLSSEEAVKIGERARRRILAEHTYARRAAELDDLLNERFQDSSMEEAVWTAAR
ncbi:MAG: glycosyltransferase [Phycisphaerae bacterium]|nr:glycosyltransferase [Phycisphaerae bacterium]